MDQKAEGSSAPRARPRKTRPAGAGRAEAARSPSKRDDGATKIAIVAAVALAVGVAAGWFARGAGPASGVSVRPDPAASASAAPVESGPCGEWAGELCRRAGDSSEGCEHAKSAVPLLPAAACVAARADLDATVARLETARASCRTLTDKLCGDLGPDTKTCAMVREKTPSFPTERCKEMLAGYDGVLTELKSMAKADAPLSDELAAKNGAGEAPGFGSAQAKVTIVEYSDFACPFCARGAAVVEKLKEKYADRVRFVFRQYPLPMHEQAPLAAEAALAAHAQGKFWPLHDILFENQRRLDRAALEEYAGKAGLDMPKFKKALDEHTYAAAVKADMALGEEVGVSGTPTMFIGPERVDNPTDFDAVARQLDARLAK